MLMIEEITFAFAVSIAVASRVYCYFCQFSIKWPAFHFSFTLLDSLKIALSLLGCHSFFTTFEYLIEMFL